MAFPMMAATAGLASRCEIQLAYAIGVSHPVSINVNTFGTGIIEEALIEKAVDQVFDLRPAAIIRELGLRRPIWRPMDTWAGRTWTSSGRRPTG